VPQIRFEGRLRHPEPPAPIGKREAALDGGHRSGRVAEPMLAELGRLDRGDDGRPPRSAGDRVPGLERLADAAQPPQEVGTVDRDPLVVPWPTKGLATVPADRHPTVLRRAAEVRSASRRPPWLLGNWSLGRGRRGAAGLRSGRGRIRREGRVQAGDGLVEPMLPPEGPSEPGQVTARGMGSRRRVAESLIEVDEEAGERADVLVVMADDGRQGLSGPAAEEAEVPARDLPAVDVVVADETEQCPFDRRQASVVHPVAE
jgi:hypothetical protein